MSDWHARAIEIRHDLSDEIKNRCKREVSKRPQDHFDEFVLDTLAQLIARIEQLEARHVGQ